jgi:hypothetical protein
LASAADEKLRNRLSIRFLSVLLDVNTPACIEWPIVWRALAMRGSTFLLFGLAGLVTFATPAAQAASVKDLFEQRGLLGIWSADCTKPASQQNQYIVHRALDAAHVQRDTMVSATERIAVVVLETAAVSAPNELTMAASGHGARLSISYRFEGKRLRVMQFVREDGTKFIVDGRRVGAGEMPWLNKCG